MPAKKRIRDPIKLVVFDVGNVLLWFDLNRAARNFDRCEAGKGKLLKERIWLSPLMVRFETGRITGRGLFTRLKTEFQLKMSYAQFVSSINDIFDPIHPNLQLLRQLSSRVKTALLSNTNPVHWAHIHKTYPDLKHAHWPYSSHILGSMKPATKIFRALSRETGVPLRESLLIDDRPENVAAARKLGMRAVRFTGRRPLKKILDRFGLISRNGIEKPALTHPSNSLSRLRERVRERGFRK